VEVNVAVVQGSNAFLPGEIPPRKCGGKSAEAVVMSNEPGVAKDPYKLETGELGAMKGRTDEESFDPVEDIQTDTASWQGEDESRHGGKHGGVRGEAAGRKLEVAASETEQDGNIRFRI
jgi:hypothetical protein